MNKVLVIFGLLVAGIPPAAFAQQPQSYTQNAVYVEGLGQGFLYSVNFDHRFTENIAVRAGFSHFSLGFFTDVTVTTIPLMLEYLTGSGSHHLEFGLGIVPLYGSISTSFLGRSEGSVGEWAVIGTATLGYRYQPLGEGFLFRVGISPFFASNAAQFWGGVSIGWAF